MNITSYTATLEIEHSFFGKARMGSLEPFADFCRKVVADRNFTEDEHRQLIDIVHTAICKFFKEYPKTRAGILRIQLELGSSLKSLRFVAEGYCGGGNLSYPTGDRIEGETDLYKEEYNQYLKELKTKENENAQRFYTDIQVEAVAAKQEPLDVEREFIAPNAAMFAQRIQRHIYVKLVDRVVELIAPKLLKLPEKPGVLHLELKVADKAIGSLH